MIGAFPFLRIQLEEEMEASDPLVASVVSNLDEGQREDWEERAAVMEFDGKLLRNHAEALAVIDLLQRHPAAISGITTLSITLDGGTEYILTTDLNYARKHLADIGANEVAVVDLREVLAEQYGGTACLTFLG
jgi:hypothetical protein